VLAWVIYMTAATGTLIFAAYDPHLRSSTCGAQKWPSSLLILALTLALSFFVERPWCKYACPYGAVLGLTNLFRLPAFAAGKPLARRMARSILCPMNIPVDEKTVVRDHQCISCLNAHLRGGLPCSPHGSFRHRRCEMTSLPNRWPF
jgi:polyferredoxin